MKKILLAFDGTWFCKGAFDFAVQLNQMQPLLLIGVFVPQNNLSNLWSFAEFGKDSTAIPMIEADESAAVQENIRRFETLCQENNIRYRIHKDYFDFAIPALMNESIYADLLILGSETFYMKASKEGSDIFLREALHDMKCPVIVVPENNTIPEKIILAFDGSEDAVFAIKQFAYIFPELKNRPTVIVYADENPAEGVPQKMQVYELATCHYPNFEMHKLNLKTGNEFNNWMMENQSALLVCGSYNRSGISQLFKKSFVQEVISTRRFPVFIAHK